MKSEPAFPVPPTPSSEGMTLLDFFAAHALAGLLATRQNWQTPNDKNEKVEVKNTKQHAYLAYELAKEMLVEREKRRVAG